MANKNLDKVMSKMQSGEFIDTSALKNKDKQESENNSLDIYVKTLAMKYPIIAAKVKGMKTLDRLVLLKNLQPMIVENQMVKDN